MIDRETGLHVGYIYCITNKVNGKRYIGQTIRPLQKRFDEHIDCKKNMQYPQAVDLAIQKYGEENFLFEQLIKIIANTKDALREEIDKQEIFCIDVYNSHYTKHGYNIELGGSHCSHLMNPVDVYDYFGNYIASFESCSEAGRYYGLADTSVNSCCNGRTKRVLNPKIVFRFKGDPFDKFMIFDEDCKVFQFSFDGEFIKEYSTASIAAREVGGYPLEYHIRSNT